MTATRSPHADHFRAPPYRPVAARYPAMLEAVGAEPRRVDRARRCPRDPPAGAARSRPRSKRNRSARRICATLARAEPAVHLADRPRLFRHHPAGRDPAQHPGESGLVHGLYAVSAGDQPGAAGGAVQLPDHDLRSDRARRRQRLAARRGDRGGGGDGAGRARSRSRKPRRFFVDRELHPQTIAVLRPAPNRSDGI